MSLNDYVAVTISATGPGPSAPGFGVGLLASYHVLGGSRRVMGPYTSAAGVLADGFSSTGQTYKASLKYFAQTPQPTLLYIGRRASAFTQSVTITPVSTANGTVYTFVIGGNNGVGGVTAQYTVSGSPTLATVCTAIAATLNNGNLSATTWAGTTAYTTASYVQPTVVNGYVYHCTTAGTSGSSQPTWPTTIGATVTDGTAVWTCTLAVAGELSTFTADGSSGTHVTCTQTTAGKLVEFQCQVPASICRIAETTVDPGLAADLDAMWAENKNWYGLGVDSNSLQEIEAGAAWAEANGSVIFVVHSSDSDVADNTKTTDVASALKSNSYTRTALLFTQYSNMSFGGFAWLATRLTQTPGSDTWNFNTIASVQADSDLLVPESSVLAVQAKNGTVYTTLANLNLTQGGTSGGGEWMDQTRFIDWCRVTIQLAMVALLARNTGKVPFDDSGLAMVEATLKAVLLQGVSNGGFVPGSIVISTPSVDTIPTASKQARTLPALPWSAKLAGALHRMSIQGTASV